MSAAAILAALRAGAGQRAAAQFDAAPPPEAGTALLLGVLLDRTACVAALLPGVAADAVRAAAARLGLPAAIASAGFADALLRFAAAPDQETQRVDVAARLLVAQEPALGEAVLRPAWRGAESSVLIARAISGAWMLLGRPAQALEAAHVAAAAAPQSAEIQVHLAALLLQAGQAGAALLACGRALGAEPDSHQALRIASSALLELGHPAEAIAAANRAAQLSPLHAPHAELIRVAHAAEVAAPRAKPRTAAMPDWAKPPGSLPARPRPSLRTALRARLRVVEALLLREARTQFSNSRLGYAWALVEPMSHILLLSVVFTLLGHDSKPPIGETMLEFYMTGVLSFLFFAHLTERAMDLAHGNRHLLLVPAIGLFDILAARAVLSAATDLVVGALTLSLLIALGAGTLPADPGGVVLGYLLLFGLGLGVAAVNVVASAYSTAWEKLWPTFLRVQYFTCGVFYHPLDMPEEARTILLFNPLVHVTEWMRQAYYPHYVSPFLDAEYLLRSVILALLAGVLLFAAAHCRLRSHA